MTLPILVRPMLAKHWKFSSFIPGMYIQPKLDGIRALYQNGQMVSRDGKLWLPNILGHITNYLRAIVPPELIVDGELYVHGLPLQKINSMVAVGRTTPHENVESVSFHVFDCVSGTHFGERFLTLKQLGLHTSGGPIRLVPTYQIFSHKQSDELYSRWLSEGYEGAMYRQADPPYATAFNTKNKENRSPWLLKRKEWADIDGTIMALNPGAGEFTGKLGSFTVRIQHKGKSPQVFNVGTGLSHVQRALYWEEPWRVLFQKIKVRFRTLSVDGIPLEPRVHHIDEKYNA